MAKKYKIIAIFLAQANSQIGLTAGAKSKSANNPNCSPTRTLALVITSFQTIY
jgi:uncharacterized protein (DUF1499 family)